MKKLNSEPYQDHVPADFKFVSNSLALFRTLKIKEFELIAKTEKRCPDEGDEKGIVRVVL